jgi:uncharacterized damage-inducible protein DinB
MDIKTCRLLALYNQTANQKMDGLIRRLTDAQWTREFNGYFKTIKQLCTHIYISDYNWLRRFGRFRDFQCTKDPLFARDLNYSSQPFDAAAEYLAKREELDKKLVALAGELTENDLGGNIAFTNSKGETIRKNAGGSLLHMFNHQTHHRGMISLYLDMMKIDNDFSSLLPMV